MSIFPKVIAGILVAILVAGPAAAQSYYAPSPFEGAYVGGYAGGTFNSATAATVGGMAGVNFEVTGGVMAGAEVQGGATLGTTTTWDGLMLGRAGVVVTPETMAYGALGAGMVNGTTSWALGGGAEFAFTDQLGARAELVATGPWASGLNQTKATAGILWHIK